MVRSAGILLYRGAGRALEVLVVHPGGPFWARRDAGAWSLPKGEIDPGEDASAAARREFAEELGSPAPAGEAIDLGVVTLKSRKVIHGFALRGELDTDAIEPEMITIPWPPRSGKTIEVPEVDRAQWCSPELAREKLNPAQAAFVDRLEAALAPAVAREATAR